MRYLSPIQTSLSGKPSTVKFSPNCPNEKSLAAELGLPVAISVHLIDHHRAVLASVPGEIPLSIAFHIEATDCDSAPYRLLPDRGVNFLAPPLPRHEEARH